MGDSALVLLLGRLKGVVPPHPRNKMYSVPTVETAVQWIATWFLVYWTIFAAAYFGPFSPKDDSTKRIQGGPSTRLAFSNRVCSVCHATTDVITSAYIMWLYMPTADTSRRLFLPLAYDQVRAVGLGLMVMLRWVATRLVVCSVRPMRNAYFGSRGLPQLPDGGINAGLDRGRCGVLTGPDDGGSTARSVPHLNEDRPRIVRRRVCAHDACRRRPAEKQDLATGRALGRGRF